MENGSGRVVIYPGSFDPVHLGHVALARFVTSAGFPAGKSRLWWLPSRRNPLKADAPQATDEQRADMLRLAARDMDGVEVCTVEHELPEPSYTIDTLRYLSAKHPDCRFSLLIGSDNWLSFSQWKEHDALLQSFGVYIYPRPGFEVDTSTLPDGAVWLTGAPQSTLSSTLLRSRLTADQSIATLTPTAVAKYIHQHRIY